MLNPPNVRDYQIALDTIFLWSDIEHWTDDILKTKNVTEPILKEFLKRTQLAFSRAKEAFQKHDIQIANELSEALKNYQKAARRIFQAVISPDQRKALEKSYKEMKEEADYHAINFEPYFFQPASKTANVDISFEKKIELIISINSIAERGITSLEALFVELNNLEASIISVLNHLNGPILLEKQSDKFEEKAFNATKSLVLKVLNWPHRHQFETLITRLEFQRLNNTFELLREQFTILIHERFKNPISENICDTIVAGITTLSQLQHKMNACLEGVKNHIEFLNDAVFSEIVEHIKELENDPKQPQEMIEFAKKSLIDRHRIFNRISIFKEDSYSPGPNQRINLLSTHSKPSLYNSLKLPFIHKDQVEDILILVKKLMPSGKNTSMEEVESELEQAFLCSIILKLLHDVCTLHKIESKSTIALINNHFISNFSNLKSYVEKILEGMILNITKSDKISIIHLFINSLDPLKIYPELSKLIQELKIHRSFIDEYMDKNDILPTSVEEYLENQFMIFINQIHQKNKNLGIVNLLQFINLSSNEVKGALLPNKSLFQRAENERTSKIEFLYQSNKVELRKTLKEGDFCNPSIHRDVLKNIELLHLISEDLYASYKIYPATAREVNIPHIGDNSYRTTSVILLMSYSPFLLALQEGSLTRKRRLLLLNDRNKIAPAFEKLKVYNTLKWLAYVISNKDFSEVDSSKQLRTANLLLADALFLRSLVTSKIAPFIDEENAYEAKDPALFLEFILKEILGINLQIYSANQIHIAGKVRRRTNVALEKPFIEISPSRHTNLQEAINSTFSLSSSTQGRTSISKRNNWLVTTEGEKKQIMGQPQRHLIVHLLPRAENPEFPLPALQIPDGFILDLTCAHITQIEAKYKIVGFITRPSKDEKKYLLYLATASEKDPSEIWECLNGDQTNLIPPEHIKKIMGQGYIFLLEMI